MPDDYSVKYLVSIPFGKAKLQIQVWGSGEMNDLHTAMELLRPLLRLDTPKLLMVLKDEDA